MFKRKKMMQIGARLDGETRYSGREIPETQDEELKQYESALLLQRRGAARAARTPEISDTQFDAFMQGIREGVAEPAPRFAGLWTVASVATVTLIVIISLLAFFTGGPDPVRATEVESVSTELQGVTVNYYDNPQGVSTVKVNMPENDLW